MKKNILDVDVSIYKNVFDLTGNKVNLLTWLKSDKHKDKVDVIRSISNKKERDELKKQLPQITPAGLFSLRNEQRLIKHSRLMVVDIDSKDNLHISNFQSLKKELSHLKEIAYCGLSVSGAGYFCLIPIAFPDWHKQQFEQIKIDFKRKGINIDPCGADVCRMRCYSYDDEAYFNYDAIPYRGVYVPQKAPKIAHNEVNVGETINALVRTIIANKTDITGDYGQWFSIGCSLANELGERGRDVFHAVSAQSEKYNQFQNTFYHSKGKRQRKG